MDRTVANSIRHKITLCSISVLAVGCFSAQVKLARLYRKEPLGQARDYALTFSGLVQPSHGAKQSHTSLREEQWVQSSLAGLTWPCLFFALSLHVVGFHYGVA